MELLGATSKSTYTNIPRCVPQPLTYNDDTYALPLAKSRWPTHQLPWRPSQYVLPLDSSCNISQVPVQSQKKHYPDRISKIQKQLYQDDCILPQNEVTCVSCPVNREVFFPFRKVIIGSKLIMLPEKELNDKQLQSQTISCVPCSKGLTKSSEPYEQIVPSRSTGSCSPPERPITPPLGRSAWLNAFIEYRIKYGGIKGGTSQHDRQFSPIWKEQNQIGHQEIELRIKNIQEQTNVFKSSISNVRNDERILMNILRTYKRDTEALKEKCQYIDPNISATMGDLSWYNLMMTSYDQTPMDVRTESALLRSDFVRVHDAIGGCCYLDPRNKSDGRERNEVFCNDTFSPPLCQTIRPSVTSLSNARSDPLCERGQLIRD